MNSFAQKFVALIFIVALSTGCASSVTDAGLTQSDTPQTEQVTPNQPDNPEFGTDQDVSPIVDRPE